MGQMHMTDAGTTQDNFILPALPVGGLPISQDWLDRMKLVHNHTIPIILPSRKNILDTLNNTFVSFLVFTLLKYCVQNLSIYYDLSQKYLQIAHFYAKFITFLLNFAIKKYSFHEIFDIVEKSAKQKFGPA